MSNTRPTHPTKPKHAPRGRSVRTYELTNIEKPVDHKMKPLTSRAVVHKKRGVSKTPKHAKSDVKYVSTPTTRSVAKAKVALARAARPPAGHKHERKVKTTKLTNIEKTPSKSSKEPTAPKIDKKGWYS